MSELGKTQQGLARHLGRSATDPVVTFIVSGRRRIQIDELPAMARYLEWPVVTLLAKLLGEQWTDAEGAPAAAVAIDTMIGPLSLGDPQPDEGSGAYAAAE